MTLKGFKRCFLSGSKPTVLTTVFIILGNPLLMHHLPGNVPKAGLPIKF